MRPLACAAVLLLSAGCLGPGGSGDGNGAPTGQPAFGLEPFLSNAAGLEKPVALTHAGDGSGRLFIVEQMGLVRVWDGTLKDDPFLDLAAGGSHPVVSDRGSEQGLLGLAFHPRYEDNGRFFVHYTAVGGDVTIAEYRNPDPAGNEADPDSGRILLTQEHSKYANHNGGALAFGPDGFLYVGIGDGGSGGDPDNNAQNLDTFLGKILRLDVDTGAAAGIPYTIPPGNPFTNRGGRDEVWAYGLRNPWRFSFDRGAPSGEGRGDLWIGDVGQNAWEEVNRQAADAGGGANYGWSRFEGTHVYNSGRQAPNAVDPVAEYGHTDGGGSHCSVTGGYVYRGNDIADLQGTYLFGDFCSGFLWTLTKAGDAWQRTRVMDTGLNVSSFGEDEDGELYVLDHGGEVRKLVPA